MHCLTSTSLDPLKLRSQAADTAQAAPQQRQPHVACPPPAAWHAALGCPAAPSCWPAWMTAHARRALGAASLALAASSVRRAGERECVMRSVPFKALHAWQ